MSSKPRCFPNARVITEGSFLAPQGALVETLYIDLSGSLQIHNVRLAKLSKPEHCLDTAPCLRLSRPKVFRDTGEVLLQDLQEGKVKSFASQSVDTSSGESASLGRRLDALNVAMKLNHTKMQLSGSVKNTKSSSSSSSITFGNDWLIYCTTINSSKEDEKAWKDAFPNYKNASTIFRPTQFAQALGNGICEHLGACGKLAPIREILSDFITVEAERNTLFVLHGPTLYVEDPYQYVSEAKEGWEKLCAMIFLKSYEHAPEKEYRFAVLPVPTTIGQVFDLPVSGALKDCLNPLLLPDVPLGEISQIVEAEGDSTESKTSPTTQEYTYRRRVTRTNHSSWSGGPNEGDEGKEEQEVIEEIVTSPNEVPEPFPTEEEKQPDVIIFQQYGTKFQFIHEAYRDVETEHWRIETIRQTEREGEEGWPNAFSVPREVVYETERLPPLDPGLILEFCLNPSSPRAPLPYEGSADCSRAEIEHVLACGRSLEKAVELIPECDRERAAASAWYAMGFVLDLVRGFGPIVKSVCIVQEAVVAVELCQAAFSGALAWATFSGSGTYTLYIRNGNMQELMLPGRHMRAHPIAPSIYADALHKNGWHRKK